MTQKADPDLLEMAAHLRASGGGRGRRSLLFRWMFKRSAAFEQMLAETQPSWDSVAAAAAALGLTDGVGKPPTAERARKTWVEVRRAKGGQQKPAQAPQPAVTTAPSPALVAVSTQPTPARHAFKISIPKKLES